MTPTLTQYRCIMPIYFDRSGNAYQIDDDKEIARKSKVTLFNTKGEEFEIDASKADEYRLTDEEHRRAFTELNEQVAALGRLLGYCPNIDPIPPWLAKTGRPVSSAASFGRELLDTTAKVVESCPNIDPARIGTILGSLVHKEMATLAHGGVRSCPQIDPLDPTTVVGNIPRLRLELEATRVLRELVDSCPNIDPARIATVLGSIVERELAKRG